MSKNKVLVLGSIAYDYLMGFDENFINACSIDHKKVNIKELLPQIVESNILVVAQGTFRTILVY